MIKNEVLIVNIVVTLHIDSVSIGMGINKTISMSNTIKMTANKKNRIENGIRAECRGSKPHSNGEDFSRFTRERWETNHAIVNTRGGMISAVVDAISIKFIDIGEIPIFNVIRVIRSSGAVSYQKLLNFLMIKSHTLSKLSDIV
jgi:hypothetical protein